MNWYNEASRIDTLVTLRNIEEMDINRIAFTESINDISFVAQYYCLSALSMGKNAFLQIPIHSNECYEVVMSQIVPHFNDVRIITYSKIVTEVNLMSIKESTVNIINSIDNDINPVAYDMFGDHFNDNNLPIEISNLNWFTVDLEKINRLDADTKLANFAIFLQKTHLVNGDSFAVHVNDWAFNETLKDRLALRFLGTLCQKIQFAVDKYNKVVEVRCF
ncbi:hypothetical protein ACIFQM_24325 [Paenibacillus sp. NRS-1782]|uniref:hypothetical protein n=1 Tax=unclassified Paenibacillus TaxID=185978 RepID=UPI003D29B548